MNYRKRILIYLLVSFLGFTSMVVAIQFSREKAYKEQLLESNLSTYTDIIYKYINAKDSSNQTNIQKISPLLPTNIRITIIEKDGKVLQDNAVSIGIDSLENHTNRPELINARRNGEGSAIRLSETTNVNYYYYAKKFEELFIRVALPNDVHLKKTLEADQYFTFFFVLVFILALIIIFFISDKLGHTLSLLKEFISSIEKGNHREEELNFLRNEMGDIGTKIVNAYILLDKRNIQLAQEREKILQHFQYLNEGIAIFSSDKKIIHNNIHFIQHLNIIKDKPTLDVEDIFRMPDFGDMSEFLNDNTSEAQNSVLSPIWESKIIKHGHYFNIRLIIFQDLTFEVIIANVTKQENNIALKQQMTNNIAHELRTPVSSIRGYLETIIEMKDKLNEDKKDFFISRAFSQTCRLSELIRDISLITKTESHPELFERENINIKELIEEIVIDCENRIKTKHINIIHNVQDSVYINGNYSLIYAIFRNLIDNSIKYGANPIGKVDITINLYASDDYNYYFNFSDQGQGIEGGHLNRIFDRFYRVDKGRSRIDGGSGLGLSIVKNAIIYHKGTISARQKKERGLSFLFSIAKK